jgi:hypothetical protein
MGCGLIALWRLTPHRNLTQEAPGIRLVAPLLVHTGQCQRVLGEGVCLLQAAGQRLHLPQGKTTECLIAYRFRGHGLFHRLRE